MGYKKQTKTFFILMLGLILLIILPLLSYDPLHLYHKSWFSKESRLHGNMRLQAAGIINNYSFDSMIVGTSMLKGTSSTYASNKLGGKFVNISADASNLYERNLFLTHALEHKKIKKVIYSFDTGLDANLQKNNRSLPLNKFNYLYDNYRFNDISIYWNNKFLTCLMTFSTSNTCIGGNRGLIHPERWFNSIYKRNKSISGIKQWLSKEGRGKNIYPRIKNQIDKPLDAKTYAKKLSLTYDIIDQQLLNTVKSYQNTEFHIVFPPYSRLQYALWLKYNPLKYELYKKTVNYLVEASLKYNNLYIYLLDDLDYLDNLNNYRDMRHYNTDMNKKIVDYVAQNNYIKSLDSLQQKWKEIDEKNKTYPFLEKDIQSVLKAYDFKHEVTCQRKNNTISLKGWALSYKITSVDLYIGKKKVSHMRLKRNMDIYKKYPQYKQKNNTFSFQDIPYDGKRIKLVFKNKNRVIKKLTVKCK